MSRLASVNTRYHTTSAREPQRLSALWVPTGGVSASRNEDAHGKLIRAGFIRQSHSGIFHLLPLGRRVQDKIEALLDLHMQGLGASKVALSSITSKEIWEQSGRLEQLGSELFKFKDRKGVGYMLSPTHEEEITSLVAQSVRSYKELPLRLYQISRKYRDELRPRHGLLRTREFMMKDLYTFDATMDSALETYAKVQVAYANFFHALKLPFIKAQASSGDMGGELSHEYHLPSAIGEDTVVICDKCSYRANAEVAESRPFPFSGLSKGDSSSTPDHLHEDLRVWRGVTKDRTTLVNAWFPLRCGQVTGEDGDSPSVNVGAVQAVLPDLDPYARDPLSLWKTEVDKFLGASAGAVNRPRIVNLLDCRYGGGPEAISTMSVSEQAGNSCHTMSSPIDQVVFSEDVHGKDLNLLDIQNGDGCPQCETGTLRVEKALEVGHTFHLGTRYSEPFGAMVALPPGQMPANTQESETSSQQVYIQMGCHGIGVSRLIGAVAEHMTEAGGLQWPRIIAPFEVAVLFAPGLADDASAVCSAIANVGNQQPPDVILDDRAVSLPWKLKDASLIGYPVVVVLGRTWKTSGHCEIQCPRLGVNLLSVAPGDIGHRVTELLGQL